MIKKASDMEKNESGVVRRISGYTRELECMGIAMGCKIVVLSDKNDRVAVISKEESHENEIAMLASVASKIDVETKSE